MRIGRVVGKVTLNLKDCHLADGALLICEILNAGELKAIKQVPFKKRKSANIVVVIDQLGAGTDNVVAIAESREAANPFHPRQVPVDAYCAAILDSIDFTV